MESSAVRILALLGLAAVAASAVLLCAGPLIATLDGGIFGDSNCNFYLKISVIV
jgi:hypothetical protein